MKIIDERMERQPTMFSDLAPGQGFEVSGYMGVKLAAPVKVIDANGDSAEGNAIGLPECKLVGMDGGAIVTPIELEVKVRR